MNILEEGEAPNSYKYWCVSSDRKCPKSLEIQSILSLNRAPPSMKAPPVLHLIDLSLKLFSWIFLPRSICVSYTEVRIEAEEIFFIL